MTDRENVVFSLFSVCTLLKSSCGSERHCSDWVLRFDRLSIP